MMRRVSIACLICAVAYGIPASVDAQSGNMSDATGATVGLFSRVMIRAFAAPPAPPPTLVVSGEILDALCVERADAMLVYAGLSGEAFDEPTRTALALLRGGVDGPEAGNRMEAALVAAGAGPDEARSLVLWSSGLLAPDRPEVPDVATTVGRYNELVRAAPPAFLADPPAEFVALRHALGRLTAAANTSFASERVYPDLPPADVRYANDEDWQVAGLPIGLMDEVYLQFGDLEEVGNRRFHRVADYEDVWVLAEDTEPYPPTTVYVPLRAYCDVELQPYVLAEPVIKGKKGNR